MFSRGSKVVGSSKLLMVWLLVSEVLAIFIYFDHRVNEFGEIVYEFVSAFIPSVRNMNVSVIWGMDKARIHYAIMWILFPVIVVGLFLDRKRKWMDFMYRDNVSPPFWGWVIIVVCVLSFYFFPIWEAGPLRYLVFSIWTFAIVSCFVVFAVAVFIRALIFEIFKF